MPYTCVSPPIYCVSLSCVSCWIVVYSSVSFYLSSCLSYVFLILFRPWLPALYPDSLPAPFWTLLFCPLPRCCVFCPVCRFTHDQSVLKSKYLFLKPGVGQFFCTWAYPCEPVILNRHSLVTLQQKYEYNWLASGGFINVPQGIPWGTSSHCK